MAWHDYFCRIGVEHTWLGEDNAVQGPFDFLIAGHAVQVKGASKPGRLRPLWNGQINVLHTTAEEYLFSSYDQAYGRIYLIGGCTHETLDRLKVFVAAGDPYPDNPTHRSPRRGGDSYLIPYGELEPVEVWLKRVTTS